MKMTQVSEIIPYSRNARGHSDSQITQIVQSIRAFGFTNPLLVDALGNLIAGHGRLAAARQLGMTELPAIIVEGLTDAEQQALRLADNKLALNATWDDALLRSELMDLREGGFDLSLTGFGEDELLGLFADRTAGLTDPDDVPEAPAEPVTQPGDVWLLGRHRLVCGDATSEADAASVLNGKRANYVFTSPPYGINLEYEKGDSLAELVALITGAIRTIDRVSAPDAYATINYADIFRPGDAGFTPMSAHYHQPFVDLGWCLRGNRVWFKPFGRLSLAYGTSTTMNLREWEYVQTWRKARGKEKLREHGMTLRGVWKTFGDDAVLSDWKQFDTTTDKEVHPAAFPVVLPVTGIRCYTDENAIVFEPFSGSGTTIIAAEMTGRACHAIEISPQYCDVTVLRWQAFTGQTATRPDGTPLAAPEAA